MAPTREVTALTFLALAAEKKGDRARADRAWRRVEAFAVARLDEPRRELDLLVRIECARRLADSYRFQGRPEKAVPRLERALADLDQLQKPDPVGRRDTLRQLAGHLAAPGVARPADAEARLREALELHRRHAADDRLTRADLSGELADVLAGRGRAEEAKALRDRAAQDYRAVLEDPQAGRPEAAGTLDAFWKLQVLYQRTSQFDQAVQLIQDQAGQWAGGLIGPRLNAEQGTLRVLLGDYQPARRLLADAVSGLETQSPLNLVALPSALLNLAVAELAADVAGGRARAEKAGRRCLELYRAHALVEDLVLVETYNLLGACAAQDGDYARAIDQFKAGVDCCGRLGKPADVPRCNLLLNIALLHKSQGDLERALPACREAREVYQHFASPDDLGLAALDAAAAALLAAQARLDEADALAADVLKRCEAHKVRAGPLVITARHCQALAHLYRRDFPAAERAWREVEKLHGPHSPLLPRTLNYLALTRECQDRPDEAAELYEKAREVQKHNPLAFPVTQFTTLWRLANVADRRGRRAEARRLLGEAVAVVEQARLRTYGGPRQRAAFFAQFAPAFEQLVAWGVRDGDVATAVVAAARGRSRTLMDQLLLANVDPRQGLAGEQGEKLRRQESDLSRQVAALRAQVQQVPEEALESEGARRLLADLGEAQQEYARVYGEILNASPVYRSLGGQQFTEDDLNRLRERALGPKKLLLVYHVGREQSHLLLLGDRSRPAEAFPLTVPAAVADRVAPPPPVSLDQALAKSRGIVLRRDAGQPDPSPSPPTGKNSVPLGQAVLRALVENYLAHVADPTFKPTRGLSLQLHPKDPARPLQPQPAELLGDILLPPAARERIRARAPDCLIVVPDGALHKLPLEALLLRSGDRLAYALDDLPPLAYAPSVAVLARLADPRPSAPSGLRSLLTVSNPDYGGRLPALPFTAEESRRIRACFDPSRVTVTPLEKAQATKQEFLAAVGGKHVVHLAAHGFADEGNGNLFGALSLTPRPADAGGAGADDGFLSLHEIYALPLQDCELAVISACFSNVGPQPPLEAGATLASGFLSAGARRVVASHWGVDDESTAELMAAFFEQVTAARPGDPVGYARALQHARRKLRERSREAPFYWAPFVLIGPGD